MNIGNKYPEDWKSVDLGDISEVITKGTTPTTNGFEYIEEGVNFVKVESIASNGSFIPKMFAYVGIDCHKSFKRSQLVEGDILYTIAGALGRNAIVTDEILPANTNQAVAIIRLKEKEYNNFIYHYLRGNEIQRLIKRINVSTAQANLNLGQINKFKIPIPPLPEQQKIAEILSTVDTKIDIIDQRIAQTQNLKKGLMQRLLTKGIGHTEFKDSQLGEIPKSWEEVKLSEVSLKIGDGIHSTPKYIDNSDFYFVNGNNLVNGELKVFEKTKCVSRQEYDRLKIELNKNSVLMSINGTIGNLAIYKNEEVVFGKSASYISADESRLNYKFLYYFLQLSEVKKHYSNELTGTTIKNLSLKSIRSTPTLLPLLGEQTQIANILSTVDAKLEVLQNKIIHYQNLKKGLMQQLLTGKVRVTSLIKEAV